MIEPGLLVRHGFALRRLTVARTSRPAPGFVRVTLTGDELAGFTSVGPTDHVKLFFPDESGLIAAPRITADGLQRPDSGTVIMRDYTPRAFRSATEVAPAELDIDFLIHGDGGPAVEWAGQAAPGGELVVGGPRGSHLPPTGAARVILASDESGLPALARWIELLPDDVEIHALVELADARDCEYLEPFHVNRARVYWRDKTRADEGAIESGLRSFGPLGDDTYVWAAGEATSLIPVRRYLRRELGLASGQVDIDGYWKRGVVALDHHAPLDPSDPDEATEPARVSVAS